MWGATGIAGCSTPRSAVRSAGCCPPALVLLVAGLWLTRRGARAPTWSGPALVVWGGWLLVTGLTFSFMAGIFHAYYTVALAPAIGALVGIGAVCSGSAGRSAGRAACVAARRCRSPPCSAFFLLARTPDFLPWLRWVVAGCSGCSSRWPLAGLGRLPRRIAGRGRGRGAGRLAGRPHGVRRRRPRPRRTPARSPAPVRPAPEASADPAAVPEAGRSRARRPRSRAGRAGRPTGRLRRQRRRPVACSTGAESSDSITALLSSDADSVHLGRGRGGLQLRVRLPARQPSSR